MEFSRQEYWSGLPFPYPGDLPTQVSNMHLLHWQVNSLPLSPTGSPRGIYTGSQKRGGNGFWVHSSRNINRTGWDFNNITCPLFPLYFIQVITTVFSINSIMLLLNCKLHSPKSYNSCYCDGTSPVTVSRVKKRLQKDKLTHTLLGKVGEMSSNIICHCCLRTWSFVSTLSLLCISIGL